MSYTLPAIVLHYLCIIMRTMILYVAFSCNKLYMIFNEGGGIVDNNRLGKRLKELRKVYNYTQDYVADVIEATRQTYSHYETGRRRPSPEVLYKLSCLYNISVDDLLYLSMSYDKNIYYEAPGPSHDADHLSEFLEYFNDPKNQKKYQYHTNLEKEILFYFQKISEDDKKELIEISKIKAKKKSQ